MHTFPVSSDRSMLLSPSTSRLPLMSGSIFLPRLFGPPKSGLMTPHASCGMPINIPIALALLCFMLFCCFWYILYLRKQQPEKKESGSQVVSPYTYSGNAASLNCHSTSTMAQRAFVARRGTKQSFFRRYQEAHRSAPTHENTGINVNQTVAVSGPANIDIWNSEPQTRNRILPSSIPPFGDDVCNRLGDQQLEIQSSPLNRFSLPILPRESGEISLPGPPHYRSGM